MSGRAFVDTNVLVYLFDDDEPVKQGQARQLRADPDGPDLVVSAQVLGEFYVAVTARRHQLSYRDALILEAAAHGACGRLLTEDLADGSTIRGVTIENPFVSGR